MTPGLETNADPRPRQSPCLIPATTEKLHGRREIPLSQELSSTTFLFVILLLCWYDPVEMSIH